MGLTGLKQQSGRNVAAPAVVEALEDRRLYSAAPTGAGISMMSVFGHIATGEVPFSPQTNTPIVPDAGPTETTETPGEVTPPARVLRDLPDPVLTSAAIGYRNFADHPLFAVGGPSPDDVRQGSVADCYLLCVLSSVAEVDPNRIRNLITDDGDGTFTIHFTRNGRPTDVMVDADLPIGSAGTTAYAHVDGDGPIWVALLEKAFAAVRTSQKSYASLNMGWMDEPYTLLGAASSGDYSATSPRALLEKVDVALAAGKSVTYGTRTPADGANLVGSHAYAVESIIRDADGAPMSVKLRNPWGTDGYRVDDGVNDGYVTISALQFYDSMIGYVQASV
jgi:hypothetical protein